MSALAELKKLAAQKGLRVVDCGNGHIQVTGGPLLVNWWPESKRRTAYIGSTKQGVSGATPERVVRMALTAPRVVSGDVERKRNYRAAKKRMLRKQKTCRWCHCQLSLDGEIPGTKKATLEHIIPLKRGGLDQPNNWTLACEECNSRRGHEMPEISSAIREAR